MIFAENGLKNDYDDWNSESGFSNSQFLHEASSQSQSGASNDSR